MVEMETFKNERLIELFNKTIDVAVELAARPGETRADTLKRLEIRRIRPDDWDGVSEFDYTYDWSTDGDQTTWQMLPIERFLVVSIAGFHMGNTGNTINYIYVKIGDKKVREWFGYEMHSELNDLFIADDGCYAVKSENLRVIPNTTGASATSKAIVIGWVVFEK
jgi:hypothetical protein